MGENLSKKVSIAAHQPLEYSVFFTLTSVVPFIDETTAAALTDRFSRQVLKSSGFRAPVPESLEYKNLLKHVAVAKAPVSQTLKQNPLERNRLAIEIAQATGRMATPMLEAYSAPQRVGLNAARLRGQQALVQKLQHYKTLVGRRQAGKPLFQRRPSFRRA